MQKYGRRLEYNIENQQDVTRCLRMSHRLRTGRRLALNVTHPWRRKTFGDYKLSTGAVAGIAIVVAALGIGAVLAIFWVMVRGRKRRDLVNSKREGKWHPQNASPLTNSSVNEIWTGPHPLPLWTD